MYFKRYIYKNKTGLDYAKFAFVQQCSGTEIKVRKRQSANDAASLLHCAKCVFDKCRQAADTLRQSSSNKVLGWAIFIKQNIRFGPRA